MSYQDLIISPTLLLDEAKCRRNIKAMAEKAQKANVRLRPHFKTHQSREIGEWFKAVGVQSITVSSLDMAHYFAEDWHDITVAFPVNVRAWDKINQIASQTQLNLLFESTEALRLLAPKLTQSVGAFIKIDVGYHRTGLSPDDHPNIAALIDSLSACDKTYFKGFLAHAGHSYGVQDTDDLAAIHNDSLRIMENLKARYAPLAGHPLSISLGDTPTCSRMEEFGGIEEIRPGNFVFYDLAQWHKGSCRLEDIAVCMACPVVAKHPGRGQIVLYGGSAHFSKDMVHAPALQKLYAGLPVRLTANGWEIPERVDWQNYVVSLSQEHGILQVSSDFMGQLAIGDLVGVLPIHSCLTANLMKGYLTTDGHTVSRV